jgi:predicted enzyme related to lactoylglutathione lyase
MASTIHYVNVKCADPYQLAQFWSQVTGWPLQDDDHPGDPAALVSPPDGGPGLLFEVVSEPKISPNRVHVDLMPSDRTRDEEVERLLAVGARLIADHRRLDGTGWAVLTDPEGNEFCVERSAVERWG